MAANAQGFVSGLEFEKLMFKIKTKDDMSTNVEGQIELPMYFSEFRKVIEENTEYPANVRAILDAADKYYGSRNDAKPNVAGSAWIFSKIKGHINHYLQVNKYDCPFDYHGLISIIERHYSCFKK